MPWPVTAGAFREQSYTVRLLSGPDALGVSGSGLYPAADGTYQKTVYHTCNGKRYSTWFTAYLGGTPEQQAAVRAKVNALLSQ